MRNTLLAFTLLLAACLPPGGGPGSSGTTGSSGSNSLARIAFVSADPASLVLARPAQTITSTVTFRLEDSAGRPAGDGIVVSFTGALPGGASLSPMRAVTANGTGLVTTTLQAGPVPGSAVVTATAQGLSADSAPIPIEATLVSLRYFVLSCDSSEIGGFQYDGLQNTCTAFTDDRFGQAVATEVHTLSEAGLVPSTVQTAPDPSGPGLGLLPYQTQCPWPVDVAPDAGEFSASCDFFDPCHVGGPLLEQRTCNPRDGWATLVVYAIGEECFSDLNGNGAFDPGEVDLATCDQGEPYLDENDNGRWDPPCSADPAQCDPAIPAGEAYFDYDSNGTWTPPNGQWDARWPIWRSVKMVWTGDLDFQDRVRVFGEDGGLIAGGNVGTLDHCSAHTLQIELADQNGNPPAMANLFQDSLFIASANGARATIGVPYAGGNWVRDANGLPSAELWISDPDSTYPAQCGAPAAQPQPFSVSIELDRTLESAGTTDGGAQRQIDVVNNVVSGAFR